MSPIGKRPILEACVESVDSCSTAASGGADRIELCANLAIGGVTPGERVIEAACRLGTIPVQVLIRPRGGHFVYDGHELEVMRREIETAKALGVAGVVLGVLRADGAIDRERTSRLIAAARPMSVTFHKAFDVAPDPAEALDILIALGVDRVLTSGQGPTAREGLACLANLVRQASGRIAVMAGGRVRLKDVPELLSAGVTEIHVGSGLVHGGMVSAERVRAFVDAVRTA